MTGGIDIIEEMTGFKGRIQKEYNAHPVGKYMGPYDQNKNLKLKIQIPNSKIDFKKYTDFHHDTNQCFNFELKSYENFDDLLKIDSYSIVCAANDDGNDRV